MNSVIGDTSCLQVCGRDRIMAETLSDSAMIDQIRRVSDPKNILAGGQIHPLLAQKIERLLIEAHLHGLNVSLFEGWRSMEEQQKIFNSGRGVTRARAGGSFHNYGLAADVVFLDGHGRPSWAEHHDWDLLGKIGKNLGLKWGGDFLSIKDRTHFEYHPQLGVHGVREIYSASGLSAVWDKVIANACADSNGPTNI